MLFAKYKKYTLVLFLSLLSFSAIYARNEIPYNDKDSVIMSYTMDDIVIQSFKQNSNLSVQPVSATEISGQQIKDRNISSMKDISAFVPNLFLPDYGSKMTSPIYIRGIGSRTNTPSVGLYVDGVPYFDRSSFDLNMNDIDRIEVLRGSQGTLYGRNTMGGVINVYSKSPFKYKETNVNLSAGSYDNYKMGASHYGNIKDKFGYSVSGNYMTAGGYFNNITTGKKADPMDAVATRLRLNYKVSSQLKINLTSAYEYTDQDGYPYALYNREDNTVGKINYNARSFYRRNMSTTGLGIKYITNSFRLSSQSSFQYFDGKQGLDQDFSPKDTYYANYLDRQQMYSQEFNIKSITKSRYKWQFGLFGFYQNYYYQSDLDVRDPNIALKTYKNKIQNVKNPTMGVAVYHQSTINDIIVEGLGLSIGLRYDWEKAKAKTEAREVKTDGTEKKQEPRGDDHFSQVTPKVTLQYTFAGNKIVYGSVTKGYKSGGFNPSAQLKEDFSYNPEHSWSYEVGAKAGCFGNLIHTDVSLFYINWEDQQISQTQPDGKGYILRNAGKSVSKGVEATLHINPFKSLSFHANYGFTYATFKHYEKDAITNYNGKYLPMVPKHTLSLSGDYSLYFDNSRFLDKVTFNAQYKGLGRIYWKEENDASQSFYGLFDGRVSFVRKQVSLDFWMKNITNKKYVSYYFFTSKAYAQEGKPFACGVNVNVTF